MSITLTKYQKVVYCALYENNIGRTLWEAYGNPSSAKESAWRWCISDMLNRNGHGSTVVCYNSHMFVFGFLTKDENRVTMLNIRTPYNLYTFPYEP